jgi:hypothetical protein
MATSDESTTRTQIDNPMKDEEQGGGTVAPDGETQPEDGVPGLCELLALACHGNEARLLGMRPASHFMFTHRFLFFQGALYMFIGLFLVVAPTAIAWCLRVCRDDVKFNSCKQMEEPEAHMWRFAGFAVFVIGYFYAAGARSSTVHFVAATTLNRFLIVPAAMLFILLVGGRKEICLVFGILDPMLAIATVASMEYAGPKDGDK